MKRLKIYSLITAALMTASMTAQGSCLIANADTDVAAEKVVADEVKAADVEEKAEAEVDTAEKTEAVEEKAETEVTENEDVVEDAEEEVVADVEEDEDVEAIAFAEEKAVANVSVSLENVNTEKSSSQMSFSIVVTNKSGASLDLSKVKLSYYYTIDGDAPEEFICDYAGTRGGDYKGLTQFVQGSTSNFTPAKQGADKELKVSFKSGAMLDDGQEAIIQVRVIKDNYNWQNKYDQSNDFSFNNGDKVAAFVDGKLVAGSTPGEINNPNDSTISPEKDEYSKMNPSEIAVDMTLNGNELSGLKDENGKLNENVDYVVNGTTVTFTQEYLDSLEDGPHSITFDFSEGNDPVFDLNVVGVVDPVITPDNGTYNLLVPSDLNVEMTLNGTELDKIMNGNEQLNEEYYTVDGTKVTFTQDYLNTLKVGTYNLTFVFKNGKKCNYKLTVVKEDRLIVEVGNVKGNPGDVVTVPVTVKGIKKEYGLYLFDFTIKYDNTKFEDVSIDPVNIPNPGATFMGTVDEAKGEIKPVFVNSTEDDDPSETIFEDGVLLNITMKIKDDAEEGVSVLDNVEGKGSFGYAPSLSELATYKVDNVDGSVTIGDPDPDNKITPNKITFDKGEAKDTNVAVSGNKLTGIDSLVEGEDYKTTATGITLLKDYLNSLSVGTTKLTFDFETGEDLTLKIEVTDPVVIVENEVTPGEITIDEGKAKDTTVSYKGDFTGIKGLTEGKDYNKSNGEVTFTADYLNSLEADTNLSFNFAEGKDVNFKINVKPGDIGVLTLSSAAMEAKAGETIKVPFTISNVPEGGFSGVTTTFNYDTDVLEAVKFEAGEIVLNPKTDVFGSMKDGEVRVIDACEIGQLIQKPGTIFYVTFKVKDNAAAGATKLSATGKNMILDGKYGKMEYKLDLGDIVIK